MLPIILFFIVLLLLGRVVHEKAERARAELAAEGRLLAQLRIRITTPAGGRPRRRDVTQRYAIENEIERRAIGNVIDASMGEDYVEMIVATRDAANAEAVLHAILAENGLTARSAMELLSAGRS